VCEEPLEHTLRGEKVLQFSCGHVSHEACFYEFMREFESQYCPTCDAPLHLDTSRGGNVLDIGKSQCRLGAGARADNVPNNTEKITNMVRTASISEPRDTRESRDARSQMTATPTPRWDESQGYGTRSLASDSVRGSVRGSISRSSVRDGSVRDSRDRDSRERDARDRDARDARDRDARERDARERDMLPSERYAGSRHGRSDSEATGIASSGDYPDTVVSGPPRRHEYDLQAMEATPTSPRPMTRNPIPAPTVTVRSEFPTINRSRQQQTLTCLVTVEVPDNKWRPDPEDLGAASPNTQRMDDVASQRPPSPARSNKPRFYPYESPEVLEEMTENLRNRVDNWHGLDFNR
jgi:hypothetical protein